MRDVYADEDGRFLQEPTERVPAQPVIDPSELGVHLERDVGQVLVLLALVQRLLEQQALRAHAKLDRAQALDARVNKVVLLLQQEEDERDVLRIAERLDRARDVLERAAPPEVFLNRGQLVRG